VDVGADILTGRQIRKRLVDRAGVIALNSRQPGRVESLLDNGNRT
jgi:hypothetical protein